MIMSHFSCCDYKVKYTLFKTYCMPLYGSPLWNFTSAHISRFYTAWRKCIRRILGVPYTTHCRLLHRICDDYPVEVQLVSRCVQFIHNTWKNNNQISSLCIRLALAGSRSNIANTMSLVSSMANVPRHKLTLLTPNAFKRRQPHSEPADDVRVIRDILSKSVTLLTDEELQLILNVLCTD